MFGLHRPRHIGDGLVLPVSSGSDVTCYRCCNQTHFRSWRHARRARRAARNHDADHQAYDRASRR